MLKFHVYRDKLFQFIILTHSKLQYKRFYIPLNTTTGSSKLLF